MTVRLIVVELAEDTTATECVSCELRESHVNPLRDHCAKYGDLKRTTRRGWVRRHPDCIASETRAARMVDLDADDPTGIPPAFRDAPPEIRMRFAEQTNRELRTLLHAVERDRQRADDALRAAKRGGGDGG